MRQDPEVQLKRPLGRPAPQLLLQRMTLSKGLRASIVESTCDAASRRGKIKRRAMPAPQPLPPPPPPPPPPPAAVVPVMWGPPQPQQKLTPQQLAAYAMPPRIPTDVRELDEAVRLVGGVSQGAVLQAKNMERLVALVGAPPFNAEMARQWKSALKAYRKGLVG
jgi:hypothetical protein